MGGESMHVPSQLQVKVAAHAKSEEKFPLLTLEQRTKQKRLRALRKVMRIRTTSPTHQMYKWAFLMRS
jgi:hypothetical protein